MIRKREHRSYNGGGTWGDFPYVSANIYTKTLHSSTTLTPLYVERERGEEKRERKKKKEEKKKRRGKVSSKLGESHYWA